MIIIISEQGSLLFFNQFKSLYTKIIINMLTFHSHQIQTKNSLPQSPFMNENNDAHNSSHHLSSIASQHIQIDQDSFDHANHIKKNRSRYSFSGKQIRTSIVSPESQMIINQQDDMSYPLRHIGLHLCMQNPSKQPFRFAKQNIIEYETIKSLQENQRENLAERHRINVKKHKSKESSTIKTGLRKWVNQQKKVSSSSPLQPEYKDGQILSIKRLNNVCGTIILQYALLQEHFENTLSLKISIRKNQSLQIFKIRCPQADSLSSQKNDSSLQPQQNRIKYKLQRFSNKLKFVLIIMSEGQEKHWKDIEIPILASNIEQYNQLVITEKPTGKIIIHFDDFKFNFFFNSFSGYPEYYALQGAPIFHEIKVEQTEERDEEQDKFCRTTCNIF